MRGGHAVISEYLSKNATHISSTENPSIKEALHLQEKRTRDRSGLFLIEGYRELLRAQEGGVVIEKLFFCPEMFLGANENTLIDAIHKKGAKLFCTQEKVFKKLSYRDRPDGLLGVARQMKYTLESLEKIISCIPSPLLVICEAIEKPGNLGTILRTSDAAGAHGVIVVDRCTDIYNPNVVRSSVGTLFTVPVIEASGIETLQWLKKNSIKTLAAMPQAQQIHFDSNMKQGIAIVLGTEQLGLSDLWRENSDLQVRIPMHGHADSLNVAQACTILLYEAVRQRR
jgi:RNA methyltransferase, TrmH family